MEDAASGASGPIAGPIVAGESKGDYAGVMKRPRRVFLSYADSDRPLAKTLAKDLHAAGFAVWSDHEVLPGDNWARKVADALEESEAMVVIVSPAAAKSKWVRREVEFALGSPRYAGRLIPVVAKPTREMWILSKLHPVSVKKAKGEVSQQVIEALEAR